MIVDGLTIRVPMNGADPYIEENTMPLTAEQYARLELVKFAVQQNIPVEHVAAFVERAAAIVLAAPKNEAA